MSITRLLLSAALALTSAPFASAQDKAVLERRGQALVAANCSRCHSIERTGNSPHREAPPFRNLSLRYPVDWLQEALAEGLSTGHPDMPEFVFEVPEIDAILAYLQSIQIKTDGPTHR